MLTAGWMAVLPTVSFGIAATDMFTPAYRNSSSFWFLLLDLKTTGWLVFPVPLSVALVVTALLRPSLASIPTIRVGLKLALALSCSYCFPMFGATFLIGLIPFGVAAIIAGVFAAVVTAPEGRRAASTLTLLVVVGLSTVSAAGGFEQTEIAIALFVLLPGAPFVCSWIIIDLLRHTTAESAPLPAYGIAALALTSTWYVTISSALTRYNELPVSSDCYVATAAATGHARIVGSAPGVDGIGVNRQLQTLKAGEIVLRTLLPRTHAQLRRIYDRLGPPASDVVRRHRLLADVAYVCLLPAHLIVGVMLRIVLAQPERKLVGGIYR